MSEREVTLVSVATKHQREVIRRGDVAMARWEPCMWCGMYHVEDLPPGDHEAILDMLALKAEFGVDTNAEVRPDGRVVGPS